MEALASIIQQISDLSFEETFLLEEYLKLQRGNQKEEILKALYSDVKSCPHCGSDEVIKWCKYKDVQRFMCKACNRTFLPRSAKVQP